VAFAGEGFFSTAVPFSNFGCFPFDRLRGLSFCLEFSFERQFFRTRGARSLFSFPRCSSLLARLSGRFSRTFMASLKTCPCELLLRAFFFYPLSFLSYSTPSTQSIVFSVCFFFGNRRIPMNGGDSLTPCPWTLSASFSSLHLPSIDSAIGATPVQSPPDLLFLLDPLRDLSFVTGVLIFSL